MQFQVFSSMPLYEMHIKRYCLGLYQFDDFI